MALRNAFSQVAGEPTLLEVRDHLAAIRSGQQGVREAVYGGAVRGSSTGRVNLGVAGNIRATIANPGTSGVNCDILLVRFFATAVGYATLYLNPTTGLPTTAVRPVLNFHSGRQTDPTVVEVRVDTSTTTALAGGTDTGITFPIPPNRVDALELPPYRLTPGNTLGISAPFAGAADCVVGLIWAVSPV